MSILNIKSYLCKQKHIMIEQIGNTGTRAAGMVLFGDELSCMLLDTRWMLIAIVLLIIADYRFGCEESSLRHKNALESKSPLLADRYEFRASRARRRTLNKFVDYLIYIMVGVSLGRALLPQIDIDYIWGGWVVTAFIAIRIEIPSIVGHFLFVRGVSVEKKTIIGFIKAFVVALAKSKSEGVGDALEEGFKATEDKK